MAQQITEADRQKVRAMLAANLAAKEQPQTAHEAPQTFEEAMKAAAAEDTPLARSCARLAESMKR